jgi:hypothetical protein
LPRTGVYNRFLEETQGECLVSFSENSGNWLKIVNLDIIISHFFFRKRKLRTFISLHPIHGAAKANVSARRPASST